ncbi:unnamed protein product [Ectocarpus sp. 13 AM-2016]
MKRNPTRVTTRAPRMHTTTLDMMYTRGNQTPPACHHQVKEVTSSLLLHLGPQNKSYSMTVPVKFFVSSTLGLLLPEAHFCHVVFQPQPTNSLIADRLHTDVL